MIWFQILPFNSCKDLQQRYKKTYCRTNTNIQYVHPSKGESNRCEINVNVGVHHQFIKVNSIEIQLYLSIIQTFWITWQLESQQYATNQCINVTVILWTWQGIHIPHFPRKSHSYQASEKDILWTTGKSLRDCLYTAGQSLAPSNQKSQWMFKYKKNIIVL